VIAEFNSISNPKNNTSALLEFLERNFEGVGTDLLDWVPFDYNPSPEFVTRIANTTYRSWAADLNNLWLVLGREHADSVKDHPERHSYVPRKYPFIVPGGRFRETYYWDSLW